MSLAMVEEEYTQGRMRVSEATAIETAIALEAHVDYLLNVRDDVSRYKDARRDINARVKAARRGIKELERLASERGWSLDPDEPLRAQP